MTEVLVLIGCFGASMLLGWDLGYSKGFFDALNNEEAVEE